jgi:hypothetical protein
MRSSLGVLIGAVPIVVIGLLAVRGAALPARWLLTTAAVLFGIPPLLGAFTRDPWRFSLIAFAWVGSLYFALGFGPGLDRSEVENVPFSVAFDRIFAVVFTEGDFQDRALEREGCVCDQCIAHVHESLRSEFLQACHLTAAFLAAALSGLATWGLFSHRTASRAKGGRTQRGDPPDPPAAGR